jgi:hypothetical protein
VKKTTQEEPPQVNIERNPIIIILSLLLTAGMMYYTFRSLFAKEVMDINPMSFFLLVPTLILSYQSLWFILNPFGLIYEDKFELKWFAFGSKIWYFVDFKESKKLPNKQFYLVYNDNETQKMNLFGIRSSHIDLLNAELNKRIASSLKTRP